MKKVDIDAITLRFFPRIASQWVRFFLSVLIFAPYAYLIFPLKNMAHDKLSAITVFLLFVLFVMADHSYLVHDISRAVGMPHAEFEGALEEYEGRRGLGTPHIIVTSGEESKRLKLLTVRGKGSRELLSKQVGRKIQIRYIEARGLLTHWSLPIHIALPTGEVIYDYQVYMDWFDSPALFVDKFIILFFRVVSIFALLFFPFNCLYRLLGQEVQNELN